MTQLLKERSYTEGYADKHFILYQYWSFMEGICNKLIPNNSLSRDLLHDTYIQLFNLPLTKLHELHEFGNMEGYIVRALYIQRNSNDSKFNRLYKQHIVIDMPDTCGQSDIDTSMLSRLNDFDMQVLAVYLKYGSITEAVKQIKISKNVFCNYINRIFAKLN